MVTAVAGPGVPVEEWSVDSVGAGDRDEYWRLVVSDTHLAWQLAPVPGGGAPDGAPGGAPGGGARDGAPHGGPGSAGSGARSSAPGGAGGLAGARVVRRRLGDVPLMECRTGRCEGRRGRREVGGGDGTVGVLVVCSGRELLAGHDDCEVEAGPGDVVVWDSRLPLRFRVLEPLRKRTLLVPRARFHVLLPRRTAPALLRVAPGSARDLFTSYLGLLVAAPLSPAAAQAGGNAALELLAAALTPAGPADRAARHRALREGVDAYIEGHLGEGGPGGGPLSTAAIARANAVSERLLYQLFEEDGDTVAGYVRRRRLEHARRDLARPGAALTVTQVAARWGFSDAAHFSRAFRAQYGAPPSRCRAAPPG